MKTFLKIGCGGFLLLVLALVAAYLLVPSTKYETRFEVDKPVDVAWRVFTDEDRTTEWLIGLQSMEFTSGDRMTPGSKLTLTFDENGTAFTMDEEITSVVENEEYGISLYSDFMDCDTVVTFEDLGDRTVVTTTNEVFGKSIFKLIAPLMKQSFIDRQEQCYAKLKAMIEAEPEQP